VLFADDFEIVQHPHARVRHWRDFELIRVLILAGATG